MNGEPPGPPDHNGDSGGPEGPDSPKKPRRSRKQRLALGGLGALMVICLVGIAAAAWGIHTLGRIERIDDVALDLVVEGEPRNYLIIGSDRRGEGDADGHDGPQLADSIVVFRVDPEEGQAAVLTIPRDLLLPLAEGDNFDPNSTPRQINHAYAGDNGRNDLAETIRKNFSIPIHHYIEIDFDGFRSLIDSVDGIDVWVDEAIHDPRTGLLIEETGCVNLDGQQALQFVRSRHIQTMGETGWESADVTADLGRGTRQREFIQQAVGKALREAPSNPGRLLGTAESLADTIAIDETLKLSDLTNLAEAFRDLDPNDPESFQAEPLPVVEAESDENRLVLDDLGAERILNVFRGEPADALSPRAIELTVLNGSGRENEATNVAGAFQELGFPIGEIGDIGEEEAPPPTTTVFHAPGEEQAGLRVARHVTGSVWVVESAEVVTGQARVVTGLDFETLHETPTAPEEMPDTTPPTEAGGDEAEGGLAEGSEGEEDSEGSEAAEAGDDGTDEEAEAEAGSEESTSSEPAPEPEQEDNTYQVGTGGSCA